MRILLYVRRGIRTRAEAGRGAFYNTYPAIRLIQVLPGHPLAARTSPGRSQKMSRSVCIS